MSFFDNVENVNQYIKMAEGYDGRELVQVLRKYLLAGAAVLELGMGPGKDLDLLGIHYHATGSDNSRIFLDKYRQDHPDADLLLLDAAELQTERQFDAIYSNKVLHHLTTKQLKQSFKQQVNVLRDTGITLHSFWYGEKEEEYSGMRFVYYIEQTIREVIGDHFDLVELQRYTELDADDSFFIVLRKRN